MINEKPLVHLIEFFNHHVTLVPLSAWLICQPVQAGKKATAEVIKLGMDIHKEKYVVVRQIDQQGPQSPQRFTPQKFLCWVKKQRSLAKRVVSCYEAGCFGYVLHRKLEAMDIENLVVRPRNWDEYGKRVKTDKRDAKELCSHLDRYLAGSEQALCVVRVPTPQQEQERSLSRPKH